MKSKSMIKFAAACIIIALLAYVAAFGCDLGFVSKVFPKFDKQVPASLDEDFGIQRGFDLAGGSVIVFEPKLENDKNVSDGDIDAAVAALRLRLDSEGLNEATVAPQITDDKKRLRVEIPAVTNPDEAIEYLGAMAKLEFKDPDGNLVMTGSEVEDAVAVYQNGEHVVQLSLTSKGQKAFAEATARLVGSSISIFLDDENISSPTVNETINSDTCIISGQFTAETARTYANQIKSGTLPFELKPVQQSSVGAQLGDDALNKSLLAGGIGLLLVIIYMIIFYRLCGVIAGIALVGYTSVVALILNGFNIQLTLPGIAGIILTIGTAVDANVVIFERIKEEIKLGKTLRTSVDSGFNRAFTAIIDSNITTIIAAVVLWYFGSGTIIGFAKTLFIGTLVSMFSAIILTKFLLRQVCGFGPKNPKLYSA